MGENSSNGRGGGTYLILPQAGCSNLNAELVREGCRGGEALSTNNSGAVEHSAKLLCVRSNFRAGSTHVTILLTSNGKSALRLREDEPQAPHMGLWRHLHHENHLKNLCIRSKHLP